ncbi:GntR family transcriptional regulator [Cuneatibacter sp. NSJ-177]|uniref:GntR family transcriptional regulator n=1 Tax=Cuneatibacter sp. NSJ-177 TaxID=2931401 RepID=UPI001FD23612|nr:GntR family transcriptional regulator [Cuneatibacter sp. NSJ-177]MCJ7837510.1 GntR family transcriptional regulator [Cuneatibacter sp. NSJ-177]
MSDLTEQVYQKFKQDLMDDKYPLNELIIEQTLVDRYGASRTPVRDAATRLVHEGYLKKYPKKGYTIRCNNEKEIKEMVECRCILECGIIDRIAENASDEEIRGLLDYMKHKENFPGTLIKRSLAFHLNMARLTGNDHLYQMLENLLFMLIRPSAVSQRLTLRDYESKASAQNYSDSEHEEIVAALLERDAEKAKKILLQDITRILQ